jgi:microcystin-dependent protein
VANLKVSENLISENNLEILPHVGAILAYAGPTAPSGWLLCNGATFNATTYPELYVLLGNSNTLPDLREKYLIGKGIGNLTLNTNVGANNHTHDYTLPAFDTSGIAGTSSHSHGIGTNFNGATTDHSHYANHDPAMDGYGNTAATYRAGNSQNMTAQNHPHSIGSYGGNTNNSSANATHSHTGNITRNDATSHSHSHAISASSTGQVSSNGSVNIPVTIYLNFIIKAG